MLANAVRLCDAKFGNLFLYEDGGLRVVASHDLPPAFAEARRRSPLHPPPGTGLCEAIETKQTVHVADLAAAQPYAQRHPAVVEAVELGGIRTFVAVPMLKDNELIGMIVIYRQEVRPFTDAQIALLTNFASQAIIAIENARLLNELRELLAQQTATSQVLQVISTSPGELGPIFQSMLENATRICEAKFGNLLLYEGEVFRVAAMDGAPPAWDELRRRNPMLPAAGKHPLARVIATRQVQHIADFRLEEGYVEGEPGPVALVEAAGARTVLVVPMLKQNELLGAIAIYRQEVLPFTDKQIALVQNFASQAVIAIENARLLSELRQRTEDLSESLQQQTAAPRCSRSSAARHLIYSRFSKRVTESCAQALRGGRRASIFRIDGRVLGWWRPSNGLRRFKEWVAKPAHSKRPKGACSVAPQFKGNHPNSGCPGRSRIHLSGRKTRASARCSGFPILKGILSAR